MTTWPVLLVATALAVGGGVAIFVRDLIHGRATSLRTVAEAFLPFLALLVLVVALWVVQ